MKTHNLESPEEKCERACLALMRRYAMSWRDMSAAGLSDRAALALKQAKRMRALVRHYRQAGKAVTA